MPLTVFSLGWGFSTSLTALDFSKYLEISSELGLPGTTVRCLEQDHNGIIWMGIEGVGLCKYDAHDFFLYQNTQTNPNVLTDNNVEAVFEDSKHRLWVGTMLGLNRLDRDAQEFIKFTQEQNGFVGNLIDDIIEDKQGNVWFGTDQGLSKYEEKSNTFSEVYFDDAEGSHPLPRINSLYIDNKGWMWVCASGGLFKVDPSNQACSRVELMGDWYVDTAPTEIFAATQDPNGNIWVGSDTCLFILNQKTGFSKSIDVADGKEASRESAIGSLITDSRGYIWVGTRMDGLRVIDPTTMVVKNRSFDPGTNAGVTSNHIRAIIEEKNGMILIAVKYAGLLIYDPRREVFHHLRGTRLINEGFKDSFIYSLRGNEKNLWIGTHSSGLYCYDSEEDSFTQYSHKINDPTSLISNRVENVFVESKDIIWAACASGVSKVNHQTGEVESYPHNALCRDIVKMTETQFWVATQSGIVILNTETGEYQNFPVIDKIDLSANSNINIRRLYKDSTEKLWIATLLRGLFSYDIAENRLEKVAPKTPTNEPMPEIRSARNFLEDSKGRLWISTRLNGLYRFDRKTGEFRNYSIGSGLPTKTVFGAVEDDKGILWLATNSGVVQFDPEKISSTIFDESYGLQGKVFEVNAFAKTSNGYFFFGGANGLNQFKPEQVKRSKYDAQITLSRIQVDGFEVIIDAVDPFLLKLPYDQNSVSISYALLDYSFPGKNEFEYRMLGLEENWMSIGTRNFVSYPSLPPGEYTFEVRGKNPNEESFSDETHFTLIIDPPFWNTAHFRILLGAVILMIVASLNFYGIYRERRQNKRLEKLVADRTSEIGKAHSQLQDQTKELEERGDEIERQNEELVQRKNPRGKPRGI